MKFANILRTLYILNNICMFLLGSANFLNKQVVHPERKSKNSRLEVFYSKGVLENFVKFTAF